MGVVSKSHGRLMSIAHGIFMIFFRKGARKARKARAFHLRPHRWYSPKEAVSRKLSQIEPHEFVQGI